MSIDHLTPDLTFAPTDETGGSAELREARARREAKRVDEAHARSWHLVQALDTTAFDTAQLGRADQVILDVEDAVADGLKDLARDNVVSWLEDGGRAWVRINDVTTPYWERDVEALAAIATSGDGTGLAGVMLAKAEAGEQVTETFRRLGGRVPVLALVESALGIETAVEIARAEGAFRLAFGSGDYRKDTGAANEAIAMAYPRTRLVLASRIGGLTGPIDGPTLGPSHQLFREQAADAVALGMTGKLCLDHEQPASINEAFSPSPADVAWAEDLLARFEAAGRVLKDGSYKPQLARAEAIVRRAGYFGVTAA